MCAFLALFSGLDKKKVVPFGVLPEKKKAVKKGKRKIAPLPSSPGFGDGHDDDDDDDDDEGLTKTDALLADMSSFLATGDGTDYGQRPDTLTPLAMTCRVENKLLKLKVASFMR